VKACCRLGLRGRARSGGGPGSEPDALADPPTVPASGPPIRPLRPRGLPDRPAPPRGPPIRPPPAPRSPGAAAPAAAALAERAVTAYTAARRPI